MPAFSILVYSNVTRGNHLLANWTQAASGLVFRTSAFGGFGSCEFDLKFHLNNLYDIVIGTNQKPNFITNRIRVTDQLGYVCYEGMIYDLALRNGNDTISRSANELYTVARIDYVAKGDTPKWDVTAASITSNVATLEIGAHPLQAGDAVSVSRVSLNGVFNGDYTLTAVGVGTISYALVNGNIANAGSTGRVRITTGGGTVERFFCYENAAKRELYGTRPHQQTLDGTFPLDSGVPEQIATRFVTQHKNPSKPESKVLGGTGDELVLHVSCVGLSEDLNVRQAWNENANTADTGLIVREMIEGSGRAAPWSWVGLNGWYERLVTPGVDGDIPYPPEFIKQQFGQIGSSSVSISRSIVGAGQSRWDVIKAVAAYGSSTYKRMLAQVWEDRANSGQGKMHFVEMPQKRSTETGYGGFFDDSRNGQVFNAQGGLIPLWQVRAGQWITSRTGPAKSYGRIESPFDDPRMFWIETSEYDVDSYTLTLDSEYPTNAELFMGKLLENGKRRIKAPPNPV